MITTDQKQIVAVLAAVLRHRSENPIKAEAIEFLTTVNTREVSEIVGYLYSQGFPVGSSGSGFFQTVGSEERKAQYMREIGRGKKIIQKVVAGRKAQATIGELTLFEAA